jgi:hypothetical protein
MRHAREQGALEIPSFRPPGGKKEAPQVRGRQSAREGSACLTAVSAPGAPTGEALPLPRCPPGW